MSRKHSNRSGIDYDAANQAAGVMYNTFQRRRAAWESLHVNHKKTGKLDMTRLAKIYTDDDVYKRRQFLPEGKSHGIFVLLDWSASMDEVRVEAMTQLYTLYRFCKLAAIKFAAFQFTSGYQNIKTHDKVLDTVLKGIDYQMVIDDSVQFIDSREWIERAFSRSQGGTPLQNSIIASAYMANSLFAEHNIQSRNLIIISDGDNSDRSITSFTSTETYKQYVNKDNDSLVSAVAFANDMGIKTYNIHIEHGFDTKGINDSSRSSNRFGKDSFAKVRADEPSLVAWHVPHPSYACMKNCYPFKECVVVSNDVLEGKSFGHGIKPVAGAESMYSQAARNSVADYVVARVCDVYTSA